MILTPGCGLGPGETSMEGCPASMVAFYQHSRKKNWSPAEIIRSPSSSHDELFLSCSPTDLLLLRFRLLYVSEVDNEPLWRISWEIKIRQCTQKTSWSSPDKSVAITPLLFPWQQNRTSHLSCWHFLKKKDKSVHDAVKNYCHCFNIETNRLA